MSKFTSSAFVAATFCCVNVAEAAITVSSYTYLSGFSSSYPDTGGIELTDGITFSRAWSRPAVSITLADVVNLTGWLNRDPSVSFRFASPQTVRSVTVWAADSDNAAAVGIPRSFTVRTPDNSFSRTFNVTDPPGNGSTVPFTLSGFSVTTNELVVSAEANHQWTMFSEVQFTTIPEPSTLILLSLATLTCSLRHRQPQP